MNLKNKGIGAYISLGAAVLAIIAMICLIATGVDKVWDDLSAVSVVLFVVAVIASTFTFLVEGSDFMKNYYGIGSLVSSVCLGAGIMIMIVERMQMLGLIFNGVVEVPVPAVLFVSLVFTVLAIAANCVVGFMGTTKKERE